MKKLNYDYLNAIADNCRAVDDTIGNGMENSVSMLKRYCKENYAKCRESIEELNGFVKKNRDIFFSAKHNGYFYDIRGNNGFNEWNFGGSWDVHRDGIRIYGKDYKNMDELSVMLVSKIGDSREYDHCGVDSALKTDGDAEHWVRAKLLVDGFVRYTERLMTEFEKVMTDILAEQNGRLKTIADATDDAHTETGVKSVKIVYVSIG